MPALPRQNPGNRWHRPVVFDFAVAQIVGSAFLTMLGLAVLWLRPIPADIYPTFAFRPEDGWLAITAFVVINACATAFLGSLVIGSVATLARRGRRVGAVVVAALTQIVLLFGALMGTGAFVSSYRWLLVAALAAVSFAQMAVAAWLWRRVGPERRGLLVFAVLGLVAGVGIFAMLFLGQFASLYASVFGWLYLCVHALTFALFAARIRPEKVGSRRYQAVKFTAVACLLLATQDLTGWSDEAFLHVRRVYDWRCPEPAVLFDVRKSASVEWYKAKAALLPSRGAAIDDSLLAGVPAPTRRDHVVVFVIDALRRDHVGAFGYAPSPTPTIDRLAARSTVYERAYSPSPTTGYSIVSFMSGLLPQQAVESAGSMMFLPRALRHFGWSTGTSSSFDGFWDMVPVLAGVDSHAFGFDTVSDPGVSNFQPSYDAAVTTELIERMTSPGADTPRFEYIHLFAAHGPFRTQDPVGDYDAALARADAEFGRFLDALEEAEQLDRTIVIVMGDHGEGLGEHGMFAHSQALYVEQTAVPLIVWLPGADPRRVDAPLTLNHLPQIVMNALGTEWPIDTQPIVAGVTLNDDAAVQDFHIRSEHVWRAIRQPPWSYHHRKLERRVELYDLTTDPGEARDVARDNPDVVEQFRAIERAISEIRQ